MMIHDESTLVADDKLLTVGKFLKKSKHICLFYTRNKHPNIFKKLNHV